MFGLNIVPKMRTHRNFKKIIENLVPVSVHAKTSNHTEPPGKSPILRDKKLRWRDIQGLGRANPPQENIRWNPVKTTKKHN